MASGLPCMNPDLFRRAYYVEVEVTIRVLLAC